MSVINFEEIEMKTLSQLKRDLKVGTKIKCLEHYFRENRVGGITTIDKVQANNIIQDNGVRLDIPNASLVEYKDNIFKIYNVGLRDLTTDEELLLKELNECTTEEERMIDVISDGSYCYYKRKRYAKDNNIEFLLGHDFIKGLKLDFNTNKIYDMKVKGNLLYSFEIIN